MSLKGFGSFYGNLVVIASVVVATVAAVSYIGSYIEASEEEVKEYIDLKLVPLIQQTQRLENSDWRQWTEINNIKLTLRRSIP